MEQGKQPGKQTKPMKMKTKKINHLECAGQTTTWCVPCRGGLAGFGSLTRVGKR